jgi:hypothetical protein
MLGVEVNEMINQFKREELVNKNSREIVEVYENYCAKMNPTVLDGMKIGYLYGWILVASEELTGSPMSKGFIR